MIDVGIVDGIIHIIIVVNFIIIVFTTCTTTIMFARIQIKITNKVMATITLISIISVVIANIVCISRKITSFIIIVDVIINNIKSIVNTVDIINI